MNTPSLPALVTLLVCSASCLMTGCASKPSAPDSSAPSGIYSTPDTFSPLPMNQAARTDALRQKYRDEFR